MRLHQLLSEIARIDELAEWSTNTRSAQKEILRAKWEMLLEGKTIPTSLVLSYQLQNTSSVYEFLTFVRKANEIIGLPSPPDLRIFGLKISYEKLPLGEWFQLR